MLNWLLVALFVWSPLALAKKTFEERYFDDRVEMVKALKDFIREAEAQGVRVVYDTRTRSWSLIAEAWADESYNCFYGGWPSTLVTVGGKKFCSNPKKASTHYSQGTCAEGQLRCQPQLFGAKTCVGFATADERKNAFVNCEAKFLASPDKDYAFTGQFTEPEDFERLRELGDLAQNVCERGSAGVQKGSRMCQKLTEKMNKHFKAFFRGTDLKRQTPPPPPPVQQEKPVTIKPVEDKQHCVKCEENRQATVKVVDDIGGDVKKITDKVQDDVGALWKRMKEKFEASAFCDPSKLFAQGDAPSPLLMNLAAHGTIGNNFSAYNGVSKEQRMRMLAKFLPAESPTTELVSKLLDKAAPMERARSYGADEIFAQIKLHIFRGMQAHEKANPGVYNKHYKEALAEANIFATDDDANISCPFPSEDAFRKAYAGFQKIKGGADVSKKQRLTIVDYSMPSNARRMFVMDMSSEDVLHNTWTAHGSGGMTAEDRQFEAKAQWNEAPVHFSRKSGDNATREGFMVVGQKHTSPGYGPSLQLYGKDLYNSYAAGKQKDMKMINDKVWIHPWGAPGLDYLTNKSEVIESVQNANVDPTQAGYSYSVVNTAYSRLLDGGKLGYRLSGKTYGCLGVPQMPIKALDKQGRDIDQIQALREDLPGSVLFSYSGPEQKSLYFEK